MASELGSATFNLVVGLTKFRQDMASAETEARRGGEDIGSELGEGIADGVDDEAGGGSSGRLGKALTGLATAAVAGMAAVGAIGAGLLVEGFSQAVEQRAQSARTAAALGLSEDDARAAGDIAGAAYADGYAASVEDAQGAIEAVTAQLIPDGKIAGNEAEIEGLTRKALDLGTAFRVDVADGVNAASEMISQGLAPDATTAFDLITRAMQEVAPSLRGDLLDAANEYGPMFAQLGIDGQTAMGLLVEGAKQGAHGLDKTGDALKEFTIRSSDMSATSVAAYEAMGLSAEDMSARFLAGGDTAAAAFDQVIDGLLGIEDPTERANAAIALFGTPLEDLGTGQIPQFLAGLDSTTARLDDVAGAAERMGETLEKGQSPFETFKRRAMQGIVDTIDDDVFPALQRLATDAGPLLSSVGESLGTGDWSSVVSQLQELGPEIGSALGDAAETALGWLAEHAPDYLEAVGEFWVDAFRGGIEWLIREGPGIAEELGGLISLAAQWLADEGVPMLGEKLMEAGPALWQWVQDTYPQAVSAWLGILTALGAWFITDGVPWLAEKGAELWAALFEWLWTEAVPSLLRGLGSLLGAIIGWAAENGPGLLLEGAKLLGSLLLWLVTDGPAKVREGLAGLLGAIVAWLPGAITSAQRTGREWLAGLVSAAIEKGGELLVWLLTLPGRIATWITDTAIPSLREKAAEWFAVLKDKAIEKGDELLDWARDLPDDVLDRIGDVKDKLLSVGTDLIQGLIDGIREKAVDIGGEILGPIQDGVEQVKSWLGIRSPSLLFRGIGTDTIEGLLVGLEAKRSDVVDKSTTIAAAVVSPFDGVDWDRMGRTGPRPPGGPDVPPTTSVLLRPVIDVPDVPGPREPFDLGRGPGSPPDVVALDDEDRRLLLQLARRTGDLTVNHHGEGWAKFESDLARAMSRGAV